MARLTLRAVEQPDGRYRISMTPATPGVDIHRAYSGTEVRQLAERMHAEVRWVSARDETSVRPSRPTRKSQSRPTRKSQPAHQEEPQPAHQEEPQQAHQEEPQPAHEGSSAPWGGDYAAPDTAAPSDDPWGGTLSAGNED